MGSMDIKQYFLIIVYIILEEVNGGDDYGDKNLIMVEKYFEDFVDMYDKI